MAHAVSTHRDRDGQVEHCAVVEEIAVLNVGRPAVGVPKRCVEGEPANASAAISAALAVTVSVKMATLPAKVVGSPNVKDSAGGGTRRPIGQLFNRP